MLANTYQKSSKINLQHYWVSEKYDGVRAYWDGKQLISRQGNPYHAPGWFIDALPNYPLDGELWLARNQFDHLSGIVRKKKPIKSEWKKVRYMIFDLPNESGVFDQRLLKMKSILNLPKWVIVADQWKVDSEAQLLSQLDDYVDQKAEGLMLHDGRSYYSSKRSNDLIKVKPSFDMEAVVLSHEEGKGKYTGMMGAIWVEALMPDGEDDFEKKTFKIGSGFTDQDRADPPPVGSTITFQYTGLTSTGKPRFARYWRQRSDTINDTVNGTIKKY